MLILSRVCAQFHDRHGAPLFRISPADRLTFVEAPEAIRQDPLFQLLILERSLEVAQSVSQKKALENDPETVPETVPEAAPDSAGPAEPARRQKEKAARGSAASPAGT